MYNKSNTTGRSVLNFIGIIGWVAVGIGAILFLFGLSNMNGMMGAGGLVGGISSIIGGLVQVAIAQIGVAMFDQKDIALEQLKLMKRQAGEEATGIETPSSPASAAARKDPPVKSAPSSSDPSVRIYKGVEIEQSDGDKKWYARGVGYSTLGKAKQAIDASTD